MVRRNLAQRLAPHLPTQPPLTFVRGTRRCGSRAAARGPRGASAPPAAARSARRRRPCARGVDALAVRDAHDVLLDDRAGVELLGHVVGRGADDLHAALVRAGVGVGAGEGGQERVVDVDDRHPRRLEERRAEDLHVAGQDDEVDAAAEQLEQRAPRPPAWRRARPARARRARRTLDLGREVGVVGDHERDVGVSSPRRQRHSSSARQWS